MISMKVEVVNVCELCHGNGRNIASTPSKRGLKKKTREIDLKYLAHNAVERSLAGWQKKASRLGESPANRPYKRMRAPQGALSGSKLWRRLLRQLVVDAFDIEIHAEQRAVVGDFA